MKKISAILLAIALSITLCACGSRKVEGNGYNSPEEALLAYAEALKTGNVDNILSTFAVETYVERFDLAEYWDNIGTVHPSGILRLDSIDEYTKSINLITRQYAITKNLTNLYLYAAIGEQLYYPEIPFDSNPYSNADDFLDEIEMDNWTEILSEMEYDDFIYLEDIHSDKDFLNKVEDSLDKQCYYYGCGEIVSLALEVELDNEDYLLCMNVARYNNKWYNLEFCGAIGAVSGCPTITGGLCSVD